MQSDWMCRAPKFNSMDGDVWAYRDDLQRLANYLCRDPDDAEDVAHSALLKAAQKMDTFRGESTVRTWLHTITTNECRMLRRRKQPTSLDSYFDTAIDDGVRADEPNPEEIALELEARQEVLAGLEALPADYRCALLLKEGQGLSVAEVASMMGTTEAATRSTLYRARKMLRERIVA